ncbi:lipoprotein [Ideonella azotifigens]|uniref:Lipoprotein n=2 Tax=Ideonella azotifigens TaxID=513160 RepID=A0ABN1KCW1_9BURK
MMSSPFFSKAWRGLAAAAAVASLGACAIFSPPKFEPGASPAAVTQQLGQPTGDYPQPGGGHTLEFASGPFGRFTYLVRFDGDDKLVSGEQVLTERNFNAIRAGMTADEVRLAIGRPGTTFGVHYPKEIVWAYRYDSPFCQRFMVGMGFDDKVIDTAYGPDPACDNDRPFFAR